MSITDSYRAGWKAGFADKMNGHRSEAIWYGEYNDEEYCADSGTAGRKESRPNKPADRRK